MPQILNVGFRSPLVDTTAWLVIVVAALGAAFVWATPIAAALFPSWARRDNGLTWLAAVIIDDLPSVLVAATLLGALLLACAAGLLLRLEWARRAVIVLLALTIAAHLVGLSLRLATIGSGLAQSLAVAVTLAACVLLGWLIRGLMSEPVRREFA